MPRALYNEQLDDIVEDDMCLDFDGGMNSKQAPHLLQPNQYSDAQNYDYVTDMQTRPGSRILGAQLYNFPVRGLIYYETLGSTGTTVAALNSRLKKWDNSAWTDLATSGIDTSGSWVEMIQAVSYLLVGDGTNVIRRWDGTNYVSYTDTNTDPPKGNIMAYVGGRVLISGAAAAYDTIYYSSVLDVSSTGAGDGGSTGWKRDTNNIRVGAGDGQKINSMRLWDNFNVVVTKPSSTWLVNADPSVSPGSWTVQSIHRTIGCAAPQTLCQVADDMWMLTEHGVKSVRRLFQETQRQFSPSISDPIKPLIGRINRSYIQKSRAFYWNNRYFLTVPLDSSTEPNYTLIFNTITGSWTGYWTGTAIPMTAFAIQNFGGDTRMIFGTSDGKVKKLMDRDSDGIYDDDNVAIPTKITLRGMTFQDLVAEKTGKTVQIEFYKSNSPITLGMILDQNQTKTIDTGVATGVTDPVLGAVNLPFQLGFTGVRRIKRSLQPQGRFYMCQFVISSTSGFVDLRSVIASAFIESMKYRKN